MAFGKFNRAVAVALIAVVACAAVALAGCAGGAASSGASGAASAASGSAGSAASAGSVGSAGSAGSASSASSASSAAGAAGAAAGGYTEVVEADDPYGRGVHHAVVTVEGYDPFTIELDADSAPVTVSNFCKLASDGFYDGLTFYRFVDGFCMQGGSSNNSAAAANDGLTPIVGEFAQNGVENELADSFAKGTVAMARNGDPNSATSTFFVTLGSGSSVGASLNGLYAAFGTIDEAGMAIVDRIVADYLPNVTDKSMGSISDVSKQAHIASIAITD